MAAGVAWFTSSAPLHEGEPYLALQLDRALLQVLGLAAAASLVAYLTFSARHRGRIHPAERWLVVANALGFGSAYVLGAWSLSFILVLALHHEVQYLYFAYALARSSAPSGELRLLASFALWPVLGVSSWALCQLSESSWLPPLLTSGLLCHYWLDSRIWTSRARAAYYA
jgi:hypothetical protein